MKNTFGHLLDNRSEVVAPRLLGSILERVVEGRTLRARIVETEAYDQTDAASHSYKGKTPRTDVMFGPPGFLYVYFTYGMHYCCNVVTEKEGRGSAVLIRAVEPMNGGIYMEELRGHSGIDATNGPAKLCQALQISKELNGHNLRVAPLKLIIQPPLQPLEIVTTTRIGVTRAKDTPWRFYIKDNPYVSRQ